MALNNRLGAFLKFFPMWKGHIWYKDYRNHLLELRKIQMKSPIDIVFLMVDHFEPYNSDGGDAFKKMHDWCENYKAISSQFVDSDGEHPQHTWFYPYDAPDDKILNTLSTYVFDGYGEIEFHLHHGFDTSDTFNEKIQKGLEWFNLSGAMTSAEETPKQNFAYIAGDWALDNGRGDDRFSGVNNEIEILSRHGCYADFTFPARGESSQPRKVNSIYYAKDDSEKPKSYDTGIDVEVNGIESGDLMLVQGPMYLDWQNGFFETAGFEFFEKYNKERITYWEKAHVHVKNRPEWVFVKLHTHGIQSAEVYENGEFLNLCKNLEEVYKKDENYRLHYVTSREAYNIVKAAEAGKSGNPNDYRNFQVQQPANRKLHVNKPYTLKTFSENHLCLQVHNNDIGVAISLNNEAGLKITGDYITRADLIFENGLLTGAEVDGQNCKFIENGQIKSLS